MILKGTNSSDKKIAKNPKEVDVVYSSPDVVRTGIDSLGGMKIQPMAQFGGNHFTIHATVGASYKVDFYFNLANTNPDSVSGNFPVISYDANNTNGYSYYWLGHTGHYSYTLTAPDTLFDMKVLYYGATIRQSVIANWLNEKKLPLEQVQLMAGHRWISSTLKYRQNNIEQQRELMNKWFPLG